MRIHLDSLARAKRAAKALSELGPMALSKAQDAVAVIYGYRNWHDLKQVTDSKKHDQSPDDEALDAAQLSARRAYQAQQAAQTLGIGQAQAEKLIARLQPSARVRKDPEEASGAMVARAVYSPMPGTVFRPNFPAVYELLPNVRSLTFHFMPIQPGGLTPLARSAVVVYENGQRLELDGAYVWKFLDSVPPELADERGEYRKKNPYADEDLQLTVRRVQNVFALCLQKGEIRDVISGPPETVVFDIAAGTYEATTFAGLTLDEWKPYNAKLKAAAQAIAPLLQSLVDGLGARALREGYTELKYIKRAGGVSPSYEAHKWSDPKKVLMPAVFKAYSHESRFEGGCGGNKTYSDLLNDALAPYLLLVATEFCTRLREAGELKTFANLLGTSATGAKSVAEALLATKEQDTVGWALLEALSEAHAQRSLSDCARPSKAAKLPKAPGIVEAARYPGRGRVTRTRVTLYDPRRYNKTSSNQLVQLAELAQYNPGALRKLEQHVDRALTLGRVDELKEALDASSSAATYNLVDGCLSLHSSVYVDKLNMFDAVYHATLAIPVLAYVTDVSATEEYVAEPREPDFRRLRQVLEQFPFARTFDRWDLVPMLVDPEDLLRMTWGDRRKLAKTRVEQWGKLGLRHKQFPGKFGQQAAVRVLLISAQGDNMEDFAPDTDHALENAVAQELYRQLGLPQQSVRLVPLSPEPLGRALRNMQDIDNAIRFHRFLSRALHADEFFAHATTEGDPHGNTSIVLQAGKVTERWALPRSMPWSDVCRHLYGVVEDCGSPYAYLMAQFREFGGPSRWPRRL